MPDSSLPAGAPSSLSIPARLRPSIPSLPSLPAVPERWIEVARLDGVRVAGRRHRRSWAADGRAHIEVRTARRPGSEALAGRLKESLEALDGVDWAEVNGIVGRVMIGYDGDALGLTELITVVEAVEVAHGVHRETFSFDRAEHPGDGAAIRRAQLAIVADVVGLSVGVFGTLLQATPIPVELAAAFSLVDSQPRARRVLENRLGPTLTDVGLATANAVSQALAQGPLGLVVDATARSSSLLTAQARQRAWRDHPLIRDGVAARFGAAPVEPSPRPQALPRGPIETFADRAALASIGGGVATLAATRSLRRTGAVVLAGMAKPARYGREGFVAQLGRVLAGRGVLVMDVDALRRLDRVDTVVIDRALVLTGNREIDRVELADGEDHLVIHARLRAMFDGVSPTRVRRSGSWRLGPIDRARPGRGVRQRLVRQIPDGPDELLELRHRDRTVAVLSLVPQVSVEALDVVAAANDAGLDTFIAGGDEALLTRVGASGLIDDADDFAADVRVLQADGAVVLVICGARPDVLLTADCAVGVRCDGVIPWGADIVVDDVADARIVVEAAAVGHEVSRQSAAISLGATSTASVMAWVRSAPMAGSAVSATLNLLALASFANGTRAAHGLGHRSGPRALAPPPWHELSPAEVMAIVETETTGLSLSEARRRTVPLVTSEPAPVQFARAVGEELLNPLTPVLALGALASAALGSTADASIVAAVTGLNALIGGTQRFTAQRAVDALSATSAPVAHVRRAGQVRNLSVDELVVGDIVLLEAGDTVPADCRLVEGTGVEVDEAAVTGESVPVRKASAAVFAPIIAERACMLFEGTTLVAGSAEAVVVAVGNDTEAARDVVGHRPPVAGGVEARLGQITSLSIPVSLAGGALVVGAGLLHGRPLRSSMASGVSVAVAAVPEGLPMVATLAQLAAARRLSARGALVRNPRAMEALGRVDVLCTDKTGTLTEGRIELQQVSDGRTTARVDALTPVHRRVVTAAVRACPPANAHRRLAHPTDQAVLDGARQAELELTDDAPGWVRLRELPFEPTRGLHATLGQDARGELISVKGAPEIVIPACAAWAGPVRDRTLTATGRRRLFEEVDRLARQGLRILAVAERRQGVTDGAEPSLVDDDLTELVFLGFLALADPVRPTAAAAIAGLRRAGVAVVMVTGDHPSTAEGIASELGLLNGHRVVTGADLDRLSAPELESMLEDVSVFARVTPADKVRIVAAYQAIGRTVAMTGDGANDATAIRLADAGIALGERCTPAARLASDVVITDDRVETIVDAIIEGRAMWRSVRDALALLLGGNLGEIGFTVAATALTGTSPLSTRQILVVNLLTDVAPALAIATRAPHVDSIDQLIAEGPDQSLGAPLARAIAARAATTAVGAFGAWGIARVSGRARRASTVGLAAVVGTQLGQTIAAGGRDPRVLGAAVGSAAILVGIIQTPGVSQYFGCTPLGPVAWSIAAGSSVAATGLGLVAPGVVEQVARRLPGQASSSASTAPSSPL